MYFRDKTKSQLMYQGSPVSNVLRQNERLMDQRNPGLNKCAKGGRYFAAPIGQGNEGHNYSMTHNLPVKID